MRRNQLLSLARQLLDQPTAPYHEEAVARFIREFALARGLPVRTDKFGNLMVRYRRGRGHRPVVFMAHMDHPGFEAIEDSEGGFVMTRFLGNVPRDHFRIGGRVRIFSESSEHVARIWSLPDVDWSREKLVRLRVRKPVRRGEFAMWDLPAVKCNHSVIRSRACDDLAGCLALLALLEELARNRISAHVSVVFTRAEEVGFLGAMGIIKSRLIPPSALVVSIETSKELSHALMGDGPIIRVGDRATTFDARVTMFLEDVAARLAKSDRRFRHQRRLMDGGTCESAVLYHNGFRAGAVCIALGNYHNQGAGGRIREEYVDIGDLQQAVQLFIEVARRSNDFDRVPRLLKKRLDLMFERGRRQLLSTAPALRVHAAAVGPVWAAG
jgi:endoglucanase